MKTKESEGFFCVVYLKEIKKTVFYHKTWNPSKLASYLKNNDKEWLWIKVYIKKEDYYSNPTGNNYHTLFDNNNPPTDFNFRPFSKK
ncbi:hypothetical protein D1631_00015 [Chryseobacterium nematophagum]|uniref:Uncharacterized protein n=1 Tax=Chryseobacterium nematophagum TaxID=2305228 RepID=A0A3M7TNS3_9FLAO|nr:hypothetical protein [Chryseobacterium nematophagum]RNA63930.1 hypothetical protein D1631_00015 [Chryseobacterium nematophagum]